MRVAVAIALSLQPASAYVKCHGSHSSGAASPVCPDANTCIISPASGTFLGCCPSANATACPGGSATSGSTCCPFGSTCSPDGRRCNLPGTPPPPPPVKPIPMSSGAWQPAWNTCSPAVSSSLRSPGFLEVVSGSGLTIPVYSQPSSVAYGGDVTKLASPTATFVLIMQHGAARNADDYFCSGIEAAKKWTASNGLPSERVVILAPRFMEKVDAPGAGTLWWNNTELEARGIWRGGADSDPRADPTGKHRVVSSFTALDVLIESLLAGKKAGRLPMLSRIALAGHSSGGQIIQRHALFTRIDEAAARLDSTLNVSIRHLPANPSSYCSLDGKRVDAKSGAVATPSASFVARCAGYNSWHFGTDAERWPLPPRCASFPGGTKAAVALFATRTMKYMQGGNDTCACNQERGQYENVRDDPCTCESHGLETTCSDEIGGSYRLMRGRNYWKTLGEVYGGAQPPSHSLSVVPNVGHDHTLLWQSTEGIAAIFGA